MIALERAREQLQTPGLAEAAVALDASLESASQRDIAYAEFLTDLLDTELQIRAGATWTPTPSSRDCRSRRRWSSSTSRRNPASTNARSRNSPP